MNILLININLGTAACVGGIETHSEILASLLVKNKHNVIVGCWVDGMLATNTNCKIVPARRITIRNSGDMRAIIKMIRISRKENIQVIIANSGREYWPAAIAAKIAGTRIILIRHMSTPLKITTAWMINKMVDKVIAVSSILRDILIKSGVLPEKIAVIHNGIPFEKLDAAAAGRSGARKELFIDDSDIVIGAVGALHKGKGVYELLDSVRRLAKDYPSLKLLYAGDGPERGRLEEEANKLSMGERVIFTGVRKDIERMYAAMDIFTLPSTSEEAFGMVLIEAMAMGKPVIGTKIGGIPEIIKDGANGVLVPPGDSSALAAAISRYIDNSEFKARMAEEGRRTVQQEFSESVMGEKFEELFRGLGLQ